MDQYVCVSKILHSIPAIQIGVGLMERPLHYIELRILNLNTYPTSDIVLQVSKYVYDQININDTLCLPIANYCGTDTNFIVIKEWTNV